MKHATRFKSLFLLTMVSLVMQSILPVTTLAEVCIPGKCVYLPSVARPPYLRVWYDPPFVGGKSTLHYPAHIQNTSSFAIKDIVLLAQIYYEAIPLTKTYPLSLTQVSVLPAGTSAAFVFLSEQYEYRTPILTLSAITWTVVLTTEN